VRSIVVSAAALSGIVVLLLITWCALEWSGVATVNTVASDGTNRATNMRFVERDGQLLLEAGTPENAWFVDAQKTLQLRISQPSSLAGNYTIEPTSSPDGHARIRALMREKYGLRDWWIGTLFDTT
jgi:hypothetical protein